MRPRPQLHRPVSGLLLLAALTTLGGCAGAAGDRAEEFGGGDRPDPTATTTPDQPCQARVRITGPVKASWSGPASVVATLYAGPPSVYVSQQGSTRVRLFSNGPNDAPSVLVDDGSRSWGISPPAQGTIRADGSGAQVRTPLVRTGVGAHPLQLDAAFHC